MSLSDWFENRILDHLFKKSDYTPQILYVGLCTANPGEGGTGGSCNEVSNANGYSRRVALSNQLQNAWNIASSGRITNKIVMSFPEAYPSGWGTLTHFAIFNAGTYGAGDMLMYGQITPTRSTERGSLPRFDLGELIVTLN